MDFELESMSTDLAAEIDAFRPPPLIEMPVDGLDPRS